VCECSSSSKVKACEGSNPVRDFMRPEHSGPAWSAYFSLEECFSAARSLSCKTCGHSLDYDTDLARP
jgi:hypothetical protein